MLISFSVALEFGGPSACGRLASIKCLEGLEDRWTIELAGKELLSWQFGQFF